MRFNRMSNTAEIRISAQIVTGQLTLGKNGSQCRPMLSPGKPVTEKPSSKPCAHLWSGLRQDAARRKAALRANREDFASWKHLRSWSLVCYLAAVKRDLSQKQQSFLRDYLRKGHVPSCLSTSCAEMAKQLSK